MPNSVFTVQTALPSSEVGSNSIVSITLHSIAQASFYPSSIHTSNHLPYPSICSGSLHTCDESSLLDRAARLMPGACIGQGGQRDARGMYRDIKVPIGMSTHPPRNQAGCGAEGRI